MIYASLSAISARAKRPSVTFAWPMSLRIPRPKRASCEIIVDIMYAEVVLGRRY